MATLNQTPVVKAEMLIRKPVEEVFKAFIDPAVTVKFWFTKSSGRLGAGKHIRWDWEMYGVSDNINSLAMVEIIYKRMYRLTRAAWRI